jgi:uncharacterized protein
LDRLIVDTGFLVALGRSGDCAHGSALRYFAALELSLVTVSAVIVESCHFLDARAKRSLLDWVGHDGPAVIDVPVSSYPDLSATIARYANLDVDFTDAALVWLAESTGYRKIVTVDRKDFAVFRLKGGKRFELADWM